MCIQQKTAMAFAILMTSAWAADSFHKLDVRPGMWENTMTIQTSGVPQIPPEVLSKMTPEQKAMVESRLKSISGKPTVNKHCLRKEDLDKPLDFNGRTRECTHTVTVSSSSRQEIQVSCESANVKSTGVVRIEAIDPEHVKVTSHMTSGDGAKAMIIDVNGTGKWISEACTADSK